ncbi:MAG: hypothetical protein K2W96_21915 [Gemmataceae bacterium]|nr:hypothetical protein [Gemmataceae bacterium]
MAEPRAAAGGASGFAAVLLWVQGAYYLLTGLWPLVSIRTFILVSGPKTDHLQAPDPTEADHWLVMTVGALIAGAALALLAAAWRRSASPEIVVLALAMAAALGTIDVVYVSRGVIWPIYLADAAIEAALIAAWVAWLAFGQQKPAPA